MKRHLLHPLSLALIGLTIALAHAMTTAAPGLSAPVPAETAAAMAAPAAAPSNDVAPWPAPAAPFDLTPIGPRESAGA